MLKLQYEHNFFVLIYNNRKGRKLRINFMISRFENRHFKNFLWATSYQSKKPNKKRCSRKPMSRYKIQNVAQLDTPPRDTRSDPTDRTKSNQILFSISNSLTEAHTSFQW